MFGEKEVKSRTSPLFAPGRRIRGGYSNFVAYTYETLMPGFLQRTESRDTGFLQMQKIAKDPSMPPHIRRFASSRDQGSSFFTEKIFVKNSHNDNINVVVPGGGGFYRGPVMAEDIRRHMPSYQSLTNRNIEMLELFGLGGTAISRTLPLSPDTDLSVTFGELLREGVPKMIGTQLFSRQTMKRDEYLKNYSKEYLNFQFGISPLARDITATALAARRTAMQLKQMYRDSNRTIRRRYEFPVYEKRTEEVLRLNTQPFAWAGAYPGVFLDTGKLVRVRTERRETWFSGRFKYYLPEGDNLLAKADKWLTEVDRLHGVKITPETLWNLYPWTWLSDWFVTLGNVVSNVSRMGSDRIAMQYGYIMRRTTITDEYILTGCRSGGSVSGKPINDIRTIVQYERKVRYPASPYGFGLSTAEFTPQQWAILTALGITRAPGRF